MSFHTFFALTTGLSGTIRCPKGTLADMIEHVRNVETTLGLKTTQYKDNPPHWDHWQMEKALEKVDDKTLCDTVEEHNRHVRWFYARLAEWSKTPVEDGEDLTPEDAAKFWHGLEEINVPPERWTAEFYRARMETIYSVMRGCESEGITFDAKPLKPEQADAVITLFSGWLDTHDIRLAVPVGHDHLASSYEGEYDWCSKCGAIASNETHYRVKTCRKRGGCPLREDYGGDFDD